MSLKGMAKGALRGIFSILPKTDKKIIFESHSDFCDNSRVLYEYLISKGYDKTHKLVWCVEHPESFKGKKTKNIVFTSFKNKKYLLSYLFQIATAKTVFYTHLKPPVSDTNKQVVVCLWHGIPLKKISFFGETSQEAFSFLPSCGEFYDNAMKACFNASDNQLITTGFPRNDLLFQNTECLSILGIDKNRYSKVILWMPTFRQHKSGKLDDTMPTETGLPVIKNHGILDELQRVLAKNRQFVILKLHPAQDLSYIKVGAYPNISVLSNQELDNADIQLYSLVSCADVLLTDYSSIYLDYLLLDRPIGFVIDDIEEYEKNRGFVVLDPLSYMPGEKMKTPAEVYAFLDSLVAEGKDNYQEERARLCNIMHKYKDGNSSKRITERFIGRTNETK